MANQFDKKAFEQAFNGAIKTLTKAETTVKEQVRALSRSVLEATHATGDVSYVNKMLRALTPMNRKTAALYFKDFLGFHFDDKLKEFTGKNKKEYDEKHSAAMEFLEDPLNNMWSWVERQGVEVEKKVATLETLEKYVHNFIRKNQGIFTNEEIAATILRAGVTVETLIVMMQQATTNKASKPADVVDVQARQLPDDAPLALL